MVHGSSNIKSSLSYKLMVVGGGGLGVLHMFCLIHTPFLLEKLDCATNMNEGKKNIGAVLVQIDNANAMRLFPCIGVGRFLLLSY